MSTDIVQELEADGRLDSNGSVPEADGIPTSAALARELASTRARQDRLLAERVDLRRTLEQLEAENAQLIALHEQLEAAAERLGEVTEKLADAELELESARRVRRVHADTLASLSWRLTKPLRWGMAVLRSLRPPRA